LLLFSTEIRWLANQIRPFLRWHLASFFCISAGSLLALLTPLILKWLIDGIIPRKQMGPLLAAVALMFLASVGRTIANSIGAYLMLAAAQKMGLSLRMRLLRHLDTLSADYYEETPAGAASYPLKDPVDEISYFGSDLLPAILRTLLATGFSLTTMFMLSPILTFGMVPLIPVFLVARQHYRRRLFAEADRMQCDRLLWSDFLQEHLSAIVSIQLLGQEKRQERRGFCLLGRSIRSQQQLNKTASWFTISSSLIVASAVSAVIGYGGVSALTGKLSLGTLVAFYGFVTQLFEPLSGAAELYARTQKILASIRQVQSAFTLRANITTAVDSVCISKAEPSRIEFQSVEFGYPRLPDLIKIPRLRILPGEHVAIAGENGAGKSTLARLIARAYDPVRGSIQIGGIEARNIELRSLRRYVCFVPRDPVLFDGTIFSNLRFVCPAAPQRLVDEAIGCVGLSSLIASLPLGIHQRIGPGGCQLSGGERQRLAIARAILQEPGVLILDEATSCLDPAAEASVIQNLRSKFHSATLIVVSHRVSTFGMFRRILVLSRGRIVQDGSFDGYPIVPDHLSKVALER
jgi:ABC-type multidrug transport system fused ATPase/permease subunit